jgi:hypothetical protein
MMGWSWNPFKLIHDNGIKQVAKGAHLPGAKSLGYNDKERAQMEAIFASRAAGGPQSPTLQIMFDAMDNGKSGRYQIGPETVVILKNGKVEDVSDPNPTWKRVAIYSAIAAGAVAGGYLAAGALAGSGGSTANVLAGSGFGGTTGAGGWTAASVPVIGANGAVATAATPAMVNGLSGSGFGGTTGAGGWTAPVTGVGGGISPTTVAGVGGAANTARQSFGDKAKDFAVDQGKKAADSDNDGSITWKDFLVGGGMDALSSYFGKPQERKSFDGTSADATKILGGVLGEMDQFKGQLKERSGTPVQLRGVTPPSPVQMPIGQVGTGMSQGVPDLQAGFGQNQEMDPFQHAQYALSMFKAGKKNG